MSIVLLTLTDKN